MLSVFAVLLFAFLTPTSHGAPSCCKCTNGEIVFSSSGRCSPCKGALDTKIRATGECSTIKRTAATSRKCAITCRTRMTATVPPVVSKPKPSTTPQDNPKCCKCNIGITKNVGWTLSGSCSICKNKGGVEKTLPAPGQCATAKRGEIGNEFKNQCSEDCKDIFDEEDADDDGWGPLDTVRGADEPDEPATPFIAPHNPCTSVCPTGPDQDHFCTTFKGSKKCWWEKNAVGTRISGVDDKSACCCYFTNDDRCGNSFVEESLLGCECQKWPENGGPGAATPGKKTTGKCWVNRHGDLNKLVWNSESWTLFGRQGYKDHKCEFARKTGDDVVFTCTEKTITFNSVVEQVRTYSMKAAGTCNPWPESGTRGQSIEVKAANPEAGNQTEGIMQWFLLGAFGATVFVVVKNFSRSGKGDVYAQLIEEEQEQI